MSEAENVGGGVFDVDRIRKLVELMKEHELREIDLRQDEQRIRLCRGPEGVAIQPMMAAPQPMAAPAPAAPAASAAAPSAPAKPAEDGPNIAIVKSPMVGTFYARPNPESPNFVKVGDHVEPETTICIIEAMKVFNEIPAEIRGVIVAVLVENEEPVDFGKPLFKVDTSK
ncbi:MAG: acetyl-CoA carboxylase biotin carboxyl carrier protein [Planctomycetales bacterium]|nr:acetyl-CoA carboxylase biotin carboxyl carrier protein [Planctomycetales bacterium]MCA9221252.1 acetyl-CoA carboxylase biotin carboxyl carrier protein [Planctomycetales bacterium]MCA9224791.1 acetyl-CoA carboxylase biotin carboxyl carrier protein [Planctomycetales bacterium]